jgi:hypothetical protein
MADQKDVEREAAEAEIERLRASEVEIERDADEFDAESDALRLLTEIRKAIAGEIQNADGIDAVRAVLGRLFERFEIRMPEAKIRAHIRPDAIELVEDGEGGATRELRREALADNHFNSCTMK